MAVDPSYVERNRASTDRIRALATRLSDEELLHPVGEHWTVAIALAHLAFWDRRALHALDATQQAGELVAPDIDIVVNDYSLPLWAAIPPRQAAHIAIASAEALDARLESYPPARIEIIHDFYPRWVLRAAHRNEHLDEIDAALRG